MALPVVRSVGAIASGVGAITPGAPAGAIPGDVLVMFLETSNQDIACDGWAEKDVISEGTDNTRLTILWRRLNGGDYADYNRVTSDSGDHQVGRIVCIKGCKGIGDPFNITATGTDATSDTSGSIPGATTDVDNCLILAACSSSYDPVTQTATEFSSWTNGDLGSVTERIDNIRNAGNGGGIGVCSGTKAAAGAYGATAVTIVNASRKAMWSGALMPVELAENLQDNFNDNLIDEAKWGFWEAADAAVDEVNGQLEFTFLETAAQYSSALYYSQERFSIAGSYAFARVKDAGLLTTIPIQLFSTYSNRIYIYVDGTSAGCNTVINDVWGDIGWIGEYDPDVHKYFRLRESAGTYYFDYSTDGISWTNVGSGAVALPPETLELQISGEVEAADPTAVSSAVDNFNTLAEENNRAASITGKDTSNDNRNAKIEGAEAGGTEVNDGRAAKIIGKAGGTDSRAAKISGKDTGNSARSGKITGKLTENSARGAKISGVDTGISARGARIFGIAPKGLGVNYKSIDNADADIDYFQSVGVNTVRIHIPWPTGGDFTDFLAVAKKFYDAGFYTIYGCTAEISADYTWATYNTECQAAAAAAVGKCSEFNIGNEMDINNDDAYISDADLRANIRTLATAVQGIFTGVVSYVTSPGLITDSAGSDHWIAEGKGDLDLIGINVYGWADIPYAGINEEGYIGYLPQFLKEFGTGCYISEFNLEAGAANFAGIPDEDKVIEMEKMLDYIRNWGVNTMVLYQYRGYKDGDNDFAVKLMNGDWLPMWDVLLDDDLNDPTKTLYFGGNSVNTRIIPYDTSILEVGAVSDYSVGAKVFLKPKTEAGNDDNQTIANCDLDYGNVLGYLFQVDASRGCLVAYSGDNYYESSESVVTYNEWVYVAFTLTGTTLKGYVNGTLVWTQTIARVATGNSDKVFGTEYGGGRTIYGYAKDFFATKTLLSQGDITGIVADTYPTVGVHYKLDEGISFAARDTSGNTNHGRIFEPDWQEVSVEINEARSAKITGKDSANAARAAKITGKDSQNSVRSAKLSGKAAGSDNRNARATGQDTATSECPAKIWGQSSEASDRDGRILGKDTAGDSRGAKIWGVDSEVDSRGAKICGRDQANDSRLAKIHGLDLVSDLRGAKIEGGTGGVYSIRAAKLTGIDSADNVRSAKITGNIQDNSARAAKILGVDTTNESRSARIIGKDIANSYRAAKIIGNADAQDVREARIIGIDSASSTRGAKMTGKDTGSDQRNANIYGKDTSTDSKDAKIIGIDSVSDNRAAKIIGKDTASSQRSARMKGVDSASDSRGAKVIGKSQLVDLRGARIHGKSTGSDSRDSKITGSELTSDNRGAAVWGKAAIDSVRSARVKGKSTENSSRNSNITGQSTSNSLRGARCKGVRLYPYKKKTVSPYVSKDSPYSKKSTPYHRL